MKYIFIALFFLVPAVTYAGRDYQPERCIEPPRPEIPLPPEIPPTPPTPPVDPSPSVPESPQTPVTPSQDIAPNSGGGGQPLCLREPRFSGRDCPCIGRWGNDLDHCLYVYQQEKATTIDAIQRDINRARDMLQKMLESIATMRPKIPVKDVKG